MYRLITLSVLAVFLLAFSSGDARKANESYENGDYAEAAELYRQAIESDPDNARLHFNLGNSLANLDRNEEAIEVYEHYKTLTDNPSEIAMADYNIGTIHSGTADLMNAADYYRKALTNNAADADARHNYELAMRQQQEQQDNQDQEEDGDEEQEDQQEDQQQDEDQNQEGEQPDHQQDPSESPEGGQPEPPQMSLDEAQDVLEALEQRERELLRDREKETQQNESEHEQDW